MANLMGITVPLMIFLAFISFSPYREFLPGPSPGEWFSVLFAPIIAMIFLRLKRREMPPFIGFALLLCLLLFASSVFQQEETRLSAYKMPFQWILLGVVFGGVYLWLLRRKTHFTYLEYTMIAVACALALACLVQFIIGPDATYRYMPWGPVWSRWYSRWGFRTHGLLDNPLLTGTFLVTIWPLVLQRVIDGKKWFLAPGALLALGILLTGSRSCILVLLVITILQVAPRLRVYGQVVLVISALTAFAIILMTPVGERFLSILRFGGDTNLLHRMVVTEAGVDMLADHPFLGVGPGLFAKAYGTTYKPIQGQDHVSSHTLDNLIFQLACEVGLPFAMICCLVFLYMITSALRQNEPFGNGLFYAMLAYGVLSIVVALYATPLMWLLMILFAMVESRNTELRTH